MPAVVDALRELMLDGTIAMRPQLSNTLCMASMMTARAEWYDGPGPIPEEVIDRIAKELGLGRWMMRFALYGDEAVVDHNFAKLKRRFESIPTVAVFGEKHGADEWETLPNPHERVQIGVPSLDLYKMAGWSGGDEGGHVDFSPVIPLTAQHAKAAQDLFSTMCTDAGFDYLGGMLPINARATTFINVIPFDTKNEAQVHAAVRAREADGRGRRASWATASTAPTCPSWTSQRTSSASTTTRSGGSTRRSRTRSTRTASSRPGSPASGGRGFRQAGFPQQ